MKLVSVLFVCTFLVFYTGNCFSENDEICQTWINTSYVDGVKPQKLMLNYDGTFEYYKTKTSYDSIERGVFQIVKKWKDSEGNILYQIKIFELSMGKTKYMLAQVNKNRDELIFCCDPEKYPDEINESSPNFCSYKREYTFYDLPTET